VVSPGRRNDAQTVVIDITVGQDPAAIDDGYHLNASIPRLLGCTRRKDPLLHGTRE